MPGKDSKRRNAKAQFKREFGAEYKTLTEGLNKLKTVDPATLLHFKDFPLSKATAKGLQTNKWFEPTQVQRLTLPYSLLGQDVVASAKTGSGKTLAFLIPVLECLFKERWDKCSGLGAIIITPTRELAHQIKGMLDLLKKFHSRLTSCEIIGGKDLEAERKYIDSFNILICTPGRLHDHLCKSQNLNTDLLKVLVLDEADECLKNCFAREMNEILYNLPKNRQTLLFSATQTRVVKDLIRAGCEKPVFISTHENVQTPTPLLLKQNYVVIEAHEKLNVLASFLWHYRKKKVLVFMATSKQVKFFATILPILYPQLKVLSLYGAVKTHHRMERYDRFLGEDRIVMLATDVAARGLDFAEVDWVVQMDCPQDVDTYIHRVGRTARYHNKGKAILFLTPTEEKPMAELLNGRGVPITALEDKSEVKNIQHRVEDVLCKENSFIEVAERAYQNYIKSLAHGNKKIFDVTSVDTEKFSKSYGLVIVPKCRMLERILREKSKKLIGEKTKNGIETTATISDTLEKENSSNVPSEDESEGEKEEEKGCEEKDKEDEGYEEEYTPEEVTKGPHTSGWDRIFTTVTELPEHLSVTDFTKYLKGGKKKKAMEKTSPGGASLTLSTVMQIVKSNKEADKSVHKLKLKEKRSKLKEKRDSRRSKKLEDMSDDKDVVCRDSDSDMDELTEQIIAELPDPEQYSDSGTNKRPREEDDDVYTGPKVKCKRMEEEESDDEFSNTALTEQENLAIRLLAK